MQTMKVVVVLTISALCLGTFAGSAVDTSKAILFSSALKSVPPPEMPAKAAQIVLEAKASERKETTINVVKAAAGFNPASLPATVGAIARAVPEMAAEAAAVAADAQPRLAVAIARAAAGGAPAKAGRIAAAVCKTVPNQYRAVAVAVAEVVPGSGKEVLLGVGEAIPELKSSIEGALAGYSGTPASLGTSLDQAHFAAIPRKSDSSGTLALSTPLLVRGPAIGPPYIPLSGTPTNVTPGTGGEVPTGGRNYASP